MGNETSDRTGVRVRVCRELAPAVRSLSSAQLYC